MTILLALFAGLLGAVLGGAVGFFGIILIGTLAGADNQQGALAMGAATGGMPVGALIGAVLAAVLAVRWRVRARSAPVQAAPDETAAPDRDAPGGRAAPETGSPRRRGLGLWDWIALTAIALAAAGGYAWWTDDGLPPVLRKPFPVLEAELRLPADDPGLAYALNRHADLRSEIVYHSLAPPVRLREADRQVVLGLRGALTYRTDDREIELRLETGKVLGFRLDLGDRPRVTEAFTDWRRVDRFVWNRDGVPVPTDGPPPYFLRTRVVPGE
ncbi:MAG: hypothetical protein QNJ16_02935 [Rhodobacter sp.]|nr:hypothetical protein [Rhodobacter sp.]